MNAYKMAVELIIGSRLKRLSDKFLSDVTLVYRSEGIPFETAYFPVFFLLSHHGTLKVSDVARELEITQSGASQMINALEKKGMIRYDRDKGDKRIRTIAFTAEGSELLSRVLPVWDTIKNSFREILDEGENSRYFIQALDEVEETIARKNLYARISETLNKKKILKSTIFEPYGSDHGEDFRNLCLTWLVENSFAGKGDTGFINDTLERVNAGVGIARVVRTENHVIGAFYVSIENGDAVIEMFAVDQAWHHLDLEKEMLSQLLNILKEKQAHKVTVTLDRKLTRQVRQFKDAGFTLQSMVRGETDETGFLLVRTI